jgi:hypothetical protein
VLRSVNCSYAVAFICLIGDCFSVYAMYLALSIVSYRYTSAAGHHGGRVKGEIALRVPVVVISNCWRTFSMLVRMCDSGGSCTKTFGEKLMDRVVGVERLHSGEGRHYFGLESYPWRRKARLNLHCSCRSCAVTSQDCLHRNTLDSCKLPSLY